MVLFALLVTVAQADLRLDLGDVMLLRWGLLSGFEMVLLVMQMAQELRLEGRLRFGLLSK